ncbi:MAG: DNA recombination protein RmuC [Beutenbergiaceae bacterium]
MDLLSAILTISGLVAGAAIGWFVGRGTSRARTQLKASQLLAQERLADAEAGFAARLADRDDSWQQRLDDVERLAAERVADSQRQAAEHLEAEQEAARLRLQEVKADTERLKSEFAALSSKALADNSQAFLAQAEERLKRAGQAGEAELAKREEAVRAMVEPLSRTLDAVKSEMTTAEKSRAQAHGALTEQVRAMQTSSEALRTETSQLVTALRAPQVRGRWGELQLRRVVEAAGMVEHVDFDEQDSIATDDGTLRPDMVVRLPGGKNVVVDAKVAFSGYLEAMEANDDQVREARLAAHARHLRTHIDQLASKAYWEHYEASPEFVVMFVPAETFLNAALEQDPTLWEHAIERNIVVATPNTLIMLLRTIGFGWRQERLAADAQQVFTVGRELHKRLATFGKHLADLGNRLNKTVEQFNKMNRSLDSQLITQVRRFSDLQGLEPALQVAPQIESHATPASKPDLFETHGELTSAEQSALPPRPTTGDAVEQERRAALAATEPADPLLEDTLLFKAPVNQAASRGDKRKRA